MKKCTVFSLTSFLNPFVFNLCNGLLTFSLTCKVLSEHFLLDLHKNEALAIRAATFYLA